MFSSVKPAWLLLIALTFAPWWAQSKILAPQDTMPPLERVPRPPARPDTPTIIDDGLRGGGEEESLYGGGRDSSFGTEASAGQINETGGAVSSGKTNSEPVEAASGESASVNSENNAAAREQSSSTQDSASNSEKPRSTSQGSSTNESKRSPRPQAEQENQAGAPRSPGFPIRSDAPIFEEEQRTTDHEIQKSMQQCGSQVNQVDLHCGPSNPLMQQVTLALQQAMRNTPTSKNLHETHAAYQAMMQKANEHVTNYMTGCQKVKLTCHSSCKTAQHFLQQKQSHCSSGRYTCLRSPSKELEQALSLGNQCEDHSDILAKAQSDRQQMFAAANTAGLGKKLTENGEAGRTTASSEFQSSGTPAADLASDKFDLYSDELEPGSFNDFEPVTGKAQSTNYQNKTGASGPTLSGTGGSAGYGGDSAGGNSGDSAAGYAATRGSGGVIQGYSSSKGRGGGRAGYGGNGQGSESGQTYTGQRLTRAQYESLTPEEQARYRKGMQLWDFLPGGAKDPRKLQVAAYQKRDGITGATGPSIWLKVSNRYRIHQASLLPP